MDDGLRSTLTVCEILSNTNFATFLNKWEDVVVDIRKVLVVVLVDTIRD